MAFSVKSKKEWQNIFLKLKELTLAGGRKQRNFDFAGEAGKSIDADFPYGYEVMENARTGLPMLRKKK